mmetsp:Transcript_209/g.565  ORF Transcript_209/g.565 Transcript_209/m.565 type:complete len:94 (-) Transcript_209:290-571(-)
MAMVANVACWLSLRSPSTVRFNMHGHYVAYRFMSFEDPKYSNACEHYLRCCVSGHSLDFKFKVLGANSERKASPLPSSTLYGCYLRYYDFFQF